ncbi:hypothetical protein Tco_0998907 [Tanacetum coccineum]
MLTFQPHRTYSHSGPWTWDKSQDEANVCLFSVTGAWIAVYQEDHRVLGSRRSYKPVRRSDKFIRVAHAGAGVVPDVPTNLGWGGSHLPPNCIDKWSELRKRFMARFAILRACFKTEITKITQKANETLQALLSKNVGHMRVVISWTVSRTVDEMTRGVDDFVRSEEAYMSTELP